jgi:hypothetical protein
LLGAGVVTAGVELAVLGVLEVCRATSIQYAPPRTTTSPSRTTSRS